MRKKFVFAVLIISMLTFFIATSVVSVSAAGTNIAKGKPVESSGYFEAAVSDQSAEMAVDGDVNTKWCGIGDTFDEDLGHWLIIDFGAEKTINKYVVIMASLGGEDPGITDYNAVEFKFESSVDKKTWTAIDSVTENEAEKYEKSFNPIKARYVRFSTYVPALNGELTVRLPEIEVYDTDAPAASNVPTQAATTAAPVQTTAAGSDEPTQTATVVATNATATDASTTAPASEEPAVTTPAASDDTSVTPSSDFPWVVVVIVAVVVVAGGAAAFLLLKKKKA